MQVPQLMCGSVLLLVGLGATAYGLRALSGKAALPWSIIRRRTPLAPPPPRSRDVILAATLGFIVGMISLLGGLGMVLISLL